MSWKQFFQGRLLTKSEVQRVIEREQLASEQVWAALTKHPAVMLEPLVCGRCHNNDSTQFATFTTVAGERCCYCLACLTMGRCDSLGFLYALEGAEQALLPRSVQMAWTGQLSTAQQQISDALVSGLQQELPQLVWAVTGAGKTEMLYGVIQTVLQQGGLVGVASPRVDVCLELAPRLAAAFPTIEQQVLYGDNFAPYRRVPLTIATTHQLLRCRQLFDLLIVDEVDAFPYVNSASLHFAVTNAINEMGRLIYLTATLDKTLQCAIQQKQLRVHILPARYHRFPLPEPDFYWCGDWREQILTGKLSRRLSQLLTQFVQLDGTKLLFMPQIELANRLANLLVDDFPEVRLVAVHAQDPQRHEKVQQLRQGELDLLVTTTILERGVTFSHCHVCILGAEHRGFSEAALVQMSGRVGRNPHYPTGALWWLHQGVSRNMKSARQQIRQMNQRAREWGLVNE